jgi:hypothetical protein
MSAREEGPQDDASRPPPPDEPAAHGGPSLGPPPSADTAPSTESVGYALSVRSPESPGSSEPTESAGPTDGVRSAEGAEDTAPAEDPDAGAFWNTGPPEYVPDEPAGPAGPRAQASAADEEAARRGKRAALVLFGISAVLTLAPAAARMRPEGKMFLMAAVDVGIAVLGPILAIIVSIVLPRASRPAFWTTGALCILVTLLLWGVTCSVVMTS